MASTTQKLTFDRGWQVYSASLAGEIPCYTALTSTFVPQSTPTLSNFTLVSNELFTRRFLLTQPGPSGLSSGAKAGIAGGTANAVLFILILMAIFAVRKRRRVQKRELEARDNARNLEELPYYFDPSTGPQELASTVNNNNDDPQSPVSGRSEWPMGPGSPPAYRQQAPPLPVSPKSNRPPQELPGSTFIHEHHPAFTRVSNEEQPRAPATTAMTTPSTPPAPPGSPQTPPHKNPISPAVSPLGSPQIS